MAQNPQPLITHHGKLVPNPAAGATIIAGKPTVKPLYYYGNVEHIRYVLKFTTRDRRGRNPQPNRYSRTVDAVVKTFGCSESSAKAAIAGLAAYRSDVFAVEAPAELVELVEDFRRIAAKAEAASDWTAAIAARREVGKLLGCYAPVKVDVTHSQAAPVQTTLRQVMEALPPEKARQLEGVLEEWERAKADGRLVLEAGDDAPASNSDATDAEIVGERQAG